MEFFVFDFINEWINYGVYEIWLDECVVYLWFC